MKFCARCKSDQPLSNFRIVKNRPHTYCKPCDDEYRKDWHRNRRNYKIKEFVYDYRKVTPCVDCGIVGDPLIVDFDHVRGEKKFNIAHAFMKAGMTIEIVQAEIDKCEVRCRNCHAKVTHERSDTWIWEMYQLKRGKN